MDDRHVAMCNSLFEFLLFQFTYDLRNNLTQITDAAGNTTIFTYNAAGRLIKRTDSEGKIRSYEYDRNNRLVKEIRPEGQQTVYEYDNAGNLAVKVDAKNQKTAYGYDDAGRLTEIRYFAATDHDNALKTVAFSYNRAGNLTGYDDGITSAFYAYDDLHRKLSEAVN